MHGLLESGHACSQAGLSGGDSGAAAAWSQVCRRPVLDGAGKCWAQARV